MFDQDEHEQELYIYLTLASLNPSSKLSHPSLPREEFVRTVPIVDIIPCSLNCATSSSLPDVESTTTSFFKGFNFGYVKFCL